MNQNEPKGNNATHNQQQRFTTNFSYHVYNQAGFDNPFINKKGTVYLGISKMSSNF